MPSKSSSRKDWLNWWGLESDPWIDLPLTKKEYIEKFLVKTNSVEIIDNEINNLRNLELGYIKLIIGPRGSGKTSMSYYLGSVLEKNPKFISIFADTKDYTPLISDSSPKNTIWAIRQFIIVSGIKELINLSMESKSLDFLKEDLVKLNEKVQKLAMGFGDYIKELQFSLSQNSER